MFKKHKASILAFSLIIMGIVLVAALGIAAVSVTGQKNAGTTTKSTQSFQVANSGSELLLQLAKSSPIVALNAIPGWTCQSSGNVTNANVANGNAEIVFYDSDTATTPVNCNTYAGTLGDIRKIKSVGTYAGTTRAIEVAVAAGNSCEWYTISNTDSDCGGSGYYCTSPINADNPSGVSVTTAALCYKKHGGGWPVVMSDGSCTVGARGGKYNHNGSVWTYNNYMICNVPGSSENRITGVYCCK